MDHERLFDRIVSLIGAGELDAAATAMSRRLNADRENGRLWEVWGILAYAREDFDIAQSAMEEASLRVPLTARGQLVLAKCYDRSGHKESSRAIYRHVVELVDLDLDLLEPLASGLGSCGERELALEVCRRAAKAMPDCPKPLFGIVHYMRRLRRPVEQILPAMFRAHHLEPDNSEYRITLAWMLFETGNRQEAAALLEPISLGDFSCVRCLTLMQHVFESVADEENATICRKRLMVLANERNTEREHRW